MLQEKSRTDLLKKFNLNVGDEWKKYNTQTFQYRQITDIGADWGIVDIPC